MRPAIFARDDNCIPSMESTDWTSGDVFTRRFDASISSLCSRLGFGDNLGSRNGTERHWSLETLTTNVDGFTMEIVG
jgi:hypothetical protein